MFLIPIAKEDSAVRRLPVVFFVLLAINTGAFLLTVASFDERGWVARVSESARDLEEHLSAHPYLTVPRDLLRRLGPKAASEIARAQEAASPSSDAGLSWSIQEQQRELNTKAERFLALLNENAINRYGFRPSEPTALTCLLAMFLHAGFLHLLGNMLFLFLSAPFLEDLYGRVLFTALYLSSGLAAFGAEMLGSKGSATPVVGASGAIAGLMGAFLIRLGSARIRFLFMPIFFMPWMRWRFHLPAFIVLPFWLLQQVALAQEGSESSGIAVFSHIGGFLFGAAAALAIRLTRLEERYVSPAIERRISFEQHPALGRASDARRAGDFETARREVGVVLAAEPTNVDAWAEAYEIGVLSGDWADAGRRATYLLELYVRMKEQELARLHIGDALARVGRSLPTKFYVVAASYLERENDTAWALDVYALLLERHPNDPVALKALVKTADFHRRAGNVTAARELLERARQHPDYERVWRSTVDRALSELRP